MAALLFTENMMSYDTDKLSYIYLLLYNAKQLLL